MKGKLRRGVEELVLRFFVAILTFMSGSINDLLIEIILDYFEENPGVSVNALAKKAGISEASLRRVLKRQLKRPPKINLIVRLLLFIKGAAGIHQLWGRVPQELELYLTSSLGVQKLGEEEKSFLSWVKENIQGEACLHILSLAKTQKGISEREAEAYLGQRGLESLIRLYCKKILILEDGFFQLRLKTIPLEELWAFIPLTKTEAYSLSHKTNFEKLGSFFKTLSLNQQGIKKLREAHFSYYKQLLALSRDQRHSGEYHLKVYSFWDDYRRGQIDPLNRGETAN